MSGGRIGMTLARVSVTLALALSAAMTTGARTDSPQPAGIPRFELPASGLRLERPTRQGAFVDIVGRRSAFVGYEHRGLEAWVYPMKLVDDLRLAFTVEGYPLEIAGSDVLARITRHTRADDLHVCAFGVHGAPDHVCPARRARTRDAARDRVHAAADGERVLPTAPAADVAGGPADRQRRLEPHRTPV